MDSNNVHYVSRMRRNMQSILKSVVIRRFLSNRSGTPTEIHGYVLVKRAKCGSSPKRIQKQNRKMNVMEEAQYVIDLLALS